MKERQVDVQVDVVAIAREEASNSRVKLKKKELKNREGRLPANSSVEDFSAAYAVMKQQEFLYKNYANYIIPLLVNSEKILGRLKTIDSDNSAAFDASIDDIEEATLLLKQANTIFLSSQMYVLTPKKVEQLDAINEKILKISNRKEIIKEKNAAQTASELAVIGAFGSAALTAAAIVSGLVVFVLGAATGPLAPIVWGVLGGIAVAGIMGAAAGVYIERKTDDRIDMLEAKLRNLPSDKLESTVAGSGIAPDNDPEWPVTHVLAEKKKKPSQLLNEGDSVKIEQLPILNRLSISWENLNERITELNDSNDVNVQTAKELLSDFDVSTPKTDEEIEKHIRDLDAALERLPQKPQCRI